MEKQFPSLLDRIQSAFIDLLVIVLLMFIFSAFFESFGDVPNWLRAVLFLGLWGLYEPVCTAFGCTLGNYLKGIRVRKHNDYNSRINIVQALVRYVLKAGLGWLSFLTINFNPEKRAIHDLVSGSVMLNRNWEIPVEELFPDARPQ